MDFRRHKDGLSLDIRETYLENGLSLDIRETYLENGLSLDRDARCM